MFAADALIEGPSNVTNLALPVMGNFHPGGRQRGLINGGNYGNFEPCLDYVGSTFFCPNLTTPLEPSRTFWAPPRGCEH